MSSSSGSNSPARDWSWRWRRYEPPKRRELLTQGQIILPPLFCNKTGTKWLHIKYGVSFFFNRRIPEDANPQQRHCDNLKIPWWIKPTHRFENMWEILPITTRKGRDKNQKKIRGGGKGCDVEHKTCVIYAKNIHLPREICYNHILLLVCLLGGGAREQWICIQISITAAVILYIFTTWELHIYLILTSPTPASTTFVHFNQQKHVSCQIPYALRWLHAFKPIIL